MNATTTERYFAEATPDQLKAAALACWDAAKVRGGRADSDWDAPEADEARKLTAGLGWSWDFDCWSHAAGILDREAKAAAMEALDPIAVLNRVRTFLGGSDRVRGIDPIGLDSDVCLLIDRLLGAD